MEEIKILRFVEVCVPDERICWYIDESDTAEVKDHVVVPYKYQETPGIVVRVVRCVPPYTPYPESKTKPILQINGKEL